MLAAIFVPIGIAGAVIALVCALILVFALARRAAGLAGGAVGVWIVGALLSWASSFVDQWGPLFVALGALGAALVVGTLLRAVVSVVRRSQRLEPAAQTLSVQNAPVQTALVQAALVQAAPVQAPRPQEPRTQPTRVTPPQVGPSAPVTDGITVAA